MPFSEMRYDNKNIFWFVLFAANGKAEKITSYLKNSHVECFFPMRYQEKRIRNSERTSRILQPVFMNLLFVKSSKVDLDPILKLVKLQFGITSDLYYRDKGTKELIVVPEEPMRNFIAVASAVDEGIIYLSNEEVRLKRGSKIRITGGIFEGVEGIFMRIKGERRVVVSLPQFLSVATAFVPRQFILPLE